MITKTQAIKSLRILHDENANFLKLNIKMYEQNKKEKRKIGKRIRALKYAVKFLEK